MVLIGLQRLKALVLGFHLSGAASAADGVDTQRIWTQSIFRGWLAHALASRVCRSMQGEAFIVGEDSPDAAAEVVRQLRERWDVTGDAEIAGADEAFRARDRYLDNLLVFRKGARVAGLAKVKDGVDVTDLATRLAASLP